MKKKFSCILVCIVVFVSACKNETIEIANGINITPEGKEITLTVGTQRIENNQSQTTQRKIQGVSVTNYSGATQISDDIHHMVWQWQDGDVITVEVTNPSTSEVWKRDFSLESHQTNIVYLEDGQTVNKELSYDGIATFKGTMPSWWDEKTMSFNVYAGPETIGKNFADQADGFSRWMRFEAKNVKYGDNIILKPCWAIVMLKLETSLTSCDNLDMTTPKKTLSTRWTFDIRSVDIMDAESKQSALTEEAEYTYSFLPPAYFSGQNTGNNSQGTEVIFVVYPKTYEHFTVRFNINKEGWQLLDYTDIAQIDEINTIMWKTSELTLEPGSFVYLRNTKCTLYLENKQS